MTQKTIEPPPVESSKTSSLDSSFLIQLGLAAAIIILCIFLIVWGIHRVQTSDPYIHDVLEAPGNLARGQQLFWQNCATCHGIEGTGEVGPDLHHVSERRSQIALIKQVVSGKTPPMPQFQPSVKDMADLLVFLESL